MDFFEHQAKARRNTSLLVVYFLIAVVLIILAVYLAVAGVFFYGQSRLGVGRPAQTLWFPELFLLVSAATLVVIAVGSLFKIVELSGGGEAVARSLGGRPVRPNTTDLAERILLNVVEEMAIASGTPVPPVYLLDGESAINAFAAGTTPQNAVIGVTRGTIDTLKRDELQGVIAHEFSHILNGDMRLNIRLIGILNGILVIAMIGYVLMRTTSRSSYSSSSKKGGNPLPFLGLLLYIIGYVGIFFGHLIKSAVSRQREFLADASAVQFTRLPDGISGALKKIGGLVAGSRLKSERAEEASHMFFGNGLREPFLQLLATHPPLAERIRRIDPRFDGKFPPAIAVDHTADELVEPHALKSRLGAPESAHTAALAGAAAFAHDPAAAVAQIGSPQPEHVEYAAALIGSLPLEVASAVRDPLGAVATVYALLLDDEQSDVRRAQLEYLVTRADPPSEAETRRIAPFAAQVSTEARLPLVGMALPALAALSPRQREAFRDDVLFLIKADKHVSLFEYGVHRLIVKRLVDRLVPRMPRSVTRQTPARWAPAMIGLLSTLAHWGSPVEEQARRAFELGAAKLPSSRTQAQRVPREQCSLQSLDAALDQLVTAAPQIKKQVLEACAACIGADGKATIEEAELLRIVSDALDCPMPPLVNLRAAVQPQ